MPRAELPTKAHLWNQVHQGGSYLLSPLPSSTGAHYGPPRCSSSGQRQVASANSSTRGRHRTPTMSSTLPTPHCTSSPFSMRRHSPGGRTPASPSARCPRASSRSPRTPRPTLRSCWPRRGACISTRGRHEKERRMPEMELSLRMAGTGCGRGRRRGGWRRRTGSACRSSTSRRWPSGAAPCA